MACLKIKKPTSSAVAAVTQIAGRHQNLDNGFVALTSLYQSNHQNLVAVAGDLGGSNGNGGSGYSGNFVVKDMRINSSGDKVWQNFDSILPGMKLGVNHRTGRNWSITSWFSQNNPAAGAFKLEWDPSRHRLIIRQRGAVYWTSGDLKDYIDEDRPDLKLKKFENIGRYDPYKIYNFVNFTNEDEDYMSYFLEIDPDRTPNFRNIYGWKLDCDGSMYYLKVFGFSCSRF
ncbi:Uncharacterized protein Fot_42978 [Forsythia ovata]|uniref:Uncharacterized protein n=1 Tax=Forsythia ovata TaxID=205694 RepID=A0ABD1RN84_9LAMI